MPEIKLFVCCHRQTEVPRHPFLCPIQVGAELADMHFPGFLHDDTGENISTQNAAYCELTAQYWAWKNVKADYYGFFHYRRYLYPDIQAKRPYIIKRAPDVGVLRKLGYDGFEELIRRYDFIISKSENMYVPVHRHYADAPFHHEKDLKLVEQIVQERCPEYVDAMERYLSEMGCYFGNIFIMQRHVFQDYCSWLFPILEEFDRCADVSHYGLQEKRVDGYLAERLLGIYRTKHQKLSILELPRVHFLSDGRERMIKQTVGLLLPPGTRRRALAKKYLRGAAQ
jgi:hypothetical protein